MLFQSTMSRLALIAACLLPISLLARATPVGIPGLTDDLIGGVGGINQDNVYGQTGTCCYEDSCYGGYDLVTVLQHLKTDVEAQLQQLDVAPSGADASSVLADIDGLVNTATDAIKGYNLGLVGLLTGKLPTVAKLWVSLVISIVKHLSKWCTRSDFQSMFDVIGKLDLSLKVLLLQIVNLGGPLSGLLHTCVSLIAQTQIALMTKVRFMASLGALGLGGN